MIDGHTHCIHSADGTEKPGDMIEAAIALGMSYIAFTDHLDADNKYCVRDLSYIPDLDVKKHVAEISALKKEYSDKIFVALGIEFGYIREAEKEYAEVSRLPFDVIINSVHLIENDDCYMREFYEKRDRKHAYSAYLKAVAESVYAGYDYDVIGHIGYIARKAPFEPAQIGYSEFKNLYDDALAAIIERDKSLEINTHSQNTESEFLPWRDVLKRYKQLGGKKISFGSDAHRIERLGEKFGLCVSVAEELGFEGFTVYKNRKPELISFEKFKRNSD